MKLQRVFVLNLAFLLIASPASRATDMSKLMKYEKFQDITPLDATSQMLSGDTQIRPDVTAGADFTLFGRIGRVNASGVTVYAQGANMYTVIGLHDFQLTYSHQNINIKYRDLSGETSSTHDADIFKLKWVPSQNAMKFPWNGQLAIGGLMYYDNSGNTRHAVVNFSQPYAAIAVEYGRARANVGVNWIGGDLPEEAGFFTSMQYQVNPEMLLYVEYNEMDYHKLVTNHILLPRLGINCSSCDDEALSAGIAFKLGDAGYANIGAYDILDLGAPMGSLTFTRDY